MRKAHIMNAGMPAAVANAIAGTRSLTLSAAGTTTTDATVLTDDLNVITTCAALAGVRLSVLTPGDTVSVANNSANFLLVYPPTGGQINGHTADLPLTIPAKGAVEFIYTTTVNVAAKVFNG